MYKRMDPSDNDLSARSIVGEIEVALKYKTNEELLLIKIGRAKDLNTDDQQSPNSYVSVSLFDDG